MNADNLKKVLKEVELVLDGVPELVHLGDPVLRLKTQGVSPSEGLAISKQLLSVLAHYNQLTRAGIGLAAPQIGLRKSVFVLTVKSGRYIFINPMITASSPETNFLRESCLSSRLVWSDIERSSSISLEWTNEKGTTQKKDFSGFMARLIQHEYDHLQGIMGIDCAIPGSIEYCGDLTQEKLRESR